MEPTAYLTLLAAWSLAVAAPGPDVLAVLRTGAAHGRRGALAVGLGVVSGIACWIVLALTGLSVVIAAHAGVYTVVRVAGACFLMWLGVRTLWSTRRAAPTGDGEGQAPVVEGVGRCYRLGLMTNLANPKALIFFGALFSTLLPSSAGAADRAEVGASMLVIALVWFAVVAGLAGSATVVAGYRRARRAIDRAVGGLFVGIGALLLHPAS